MEKIKMVENAPICPEVIEQLHKIVIENEPVIVIGGGKRKKSAKNLNKNAIKSASTVDDKLLKMFDGLKIYTPKYKRSRFVRGMKNEKTPSEREPLSLAQLYDSDQHDVFNISDLYK